MKTVLMLAAAGAVVAVATGASADGYYVSGNGGMSELPNLTLKSNTTGNHTEHFDTGYTYGGSFGYDYGNGWRTQLDSQYTMQSLKRVDGAPVNGHVSSTSVMLDAQKDLISGSTVTPYLGAGLGMQNVGGEIGGYRGRAWKAAYQAEAGVRGDLSRELSLYGEYRFSQSGSVSMNNGVDLAHQHFSDHALMAGIAYHFGN